MSMVINQRAPDVSFDMFWKNKITRHSLADFDGKWVILLFYPADFTFVCPTELKEAASRYDEIKKMDAEIISFSTDSAYVHKAWHDSSPAIKTITYPMAADPTGNVCRVFGVYNDEEGTAWRSTFIIDPKRIVKAYEIHDISIGRSISEIIRKLSAFQYVSKHEGEVCPASWTIGQKTVSNTIENVGKI